MNTQEEFKQFRQQSRRRLIGAVVVVIIAAVVLIQVLNKKPIAENNADIAVDGKIIEKEQILENPLTEITPPVVDETPVHVEAVPVNEPVVIEEKSEEKTAEKTPEAPTQPAIKTANKANKKEELKTQKKLSPSEILSGKAGHKVFKKAEKKPIKEQKKAVQKEEKAVSQSGLNPKDILDGKTASGSLIIQVGAFSDNGQAQSVRQKLQSIGIQANIYSAYTSKGQVSRVRIVSIKNHQEAENIMNKIKSVGLNGIIISQ